jgi:hypothetical protein
MEPTPAPQPTPSHYRGWLWAALGVALAVRLAAAIAVETLAQRSGSLCLFDDTRIYWHLASTILRGEPYVVMQYDQPHHALRTPGYPLWLAACRILSRDSTLAPRLAQATLGTLAVALLAALVRRLGSASLDPAQARRAALATAWLAALEPYSAGSSALLLSEGLFGPLLIAGLYCLAIAFDHPSRPTPALAAGALQGALILTRPSYAIYPILAVPFLAARQHPPNPQPGPSPQRNRPWTGLTPATLVALGALAILAPWWIRNARIYGTFVPTSLWLGASLYDGLNPSATGASDMRFLDDPAIRNLDERTQDRLLRDRALEFVRTHPNRTLTLALIKLGRFFSPWPNAELLRSTPAALASSAIVLPLYALIAAGIWLRRRDSLSLLFLLGPLACTAAVHLAFVSSIRYRIPVLVPALGLAGFTLAARLGHTRPGSRETAP